MGVVAGVGSAIGGLSGLFGSKGKVPQPQQLQNFGAADQGAFSNTNTLANNSQAHQNLPYYQSNVFGFQNNPQVQQAGQAAFGQGQTAMNAGNAWQGPAMSLVPYATDLMTRGFDPQGEFKNRALHNTLESTRAGQAARGINMTPYGAGLEDKSVRDFNLDWENTALQRAGYAGQTAAGMIGQGANASQTGANIAASGVPLMTQGAQLPFQSNIGALDALSRAGGQVDQNTLAAIQQYLSYINRGQAGQQLGMQGQQQQFGQNQVYGSAIGQGLQALSPWGIF